MHNEPHPNATTLEAKIASRLFPLAGGHTAWTGRLSRSGGPLVRHQGAELSVSAILFARHNERPPLGMVKADCGVKHCLTASHLLDDHGRRELRLQLRSLHGLKGPWDVCKAGHGWDEYGRVEPDLTLYCAACGTARKKASARRS